MNFWERLKKPIFILAPMDGVTDTVFRQIVASCGKPDVFFTEFVPVDGLLSKGKEKIERVLQYAVTERPIVAQIWGAIPENFYQVAQMLYKMGFDGIDINMGCPDNGIIKKGACSALIKNPKLAQEIIKATFKGANGLPISVKTRIGFEKVDIEGWTRVLLQMPIAALTLHLRTVAEMSKVPAHWDEITRIVQIRDQLKSRALIIGNGDIKSLSEAKNKCQQYGIEGVMIGRGIFDNIWFFNEDVDIDQVTSKQKVELLLKHLDLFKETWGETRHFELMKKFIKCYVNNFRGALEAREELMKTRTLNQLMKTSLDYYNKLLM